MELTIDFPLTTGQLCWQAIVSSVRALCGTTRGGEETREGKETREGNTHISKHTAHTRSY